MIVYKKTDNWYIEWQRQRVVQQVTTSDNEWQRAITNDNELYNEWQRVVQRVTTSDYKWQWVAISANCFFFREEPTNKHPKENS